MKTVIEMAREAGIDEWWDSGSEWRETFDAHLERFAELVRADAIATEREACAKVCENLPMQQEYDVRDQCATAIRARSNT